MASKTLKERFGVVASALDLVGGKVVNASAKALLGVLSAAFKKGGEKIGDTLSEGDFDALADRIWASISDGLRLNPPPTWKSWSDPAGSTISAQSRARQMMEDIVRASHG
ncbi:MAG: hypothetical protein ACYTFT_04090 [Planctomycetota bacterium]|jgi:hypothetical protein